jgi:hypothetical protein
VSTELNLVACDSKAEMQERLRAAPRSLLVGEATQSPRSFYIIKLSNPNSLVVGLSLSRLGPLPGVLESQSGDRLLIGHDQVLTWVNVSAGSIIGTLPLDGAFFEFVEPTAKGVVVIHELGALKVDFDGAVSWAVPTSDIVESFQVENGNVLELRVADSTVPLRITLT